MSDKMTRTPNEQVILHRQKLMEEIPRYLKYVRNLANGDTPGLWKTYDVNNRRTLVFLNGSLVLVVPDSRVPLDNLVLQKVNSLKDINRYPFLDEILENTVFENLLDLHQMATEEWLKERLRLEYLNSRIDNVSTFVDMLSRRILSWQDEIDRINLEQYKVSLTLEDRL